MKAAHDTEAVPAWQQAQRDAITDPAELLQVLQLDEALLPAAEAAAEKFPLRVPRPFVARMEAGNPDDPLLRQVLPIGAECDSTEGYVSDPTGDQESTVVPGLLHKYHGRALLITTAACGIHCRYCFRREFPYSDSHAGGSKLQTALDWLAEHADIEEIILSGGDPLTLSDAKFAKLLEQLEAIPHLTTLRIHSRQPVVIPDRITSTLTSLLRNLRLKVVMVIHANHANEISDEVSHVLDRLLRANVSLMNQSVLLKGVNDDAEALAKLSRRLFQAGVTPYYLHQLDAVQGAAHFAVPDEQAKAIWGELHGLLPGYLVPRLAREVPGEPGKSLI